MPQRIVRKRTKGWRMPDNAMSVTRPGPWGNPFKAADAIEAGYQDGNAMAALAFKGWLAGDPDWRRPRPDAQRDFILSNLHALRGKDLACFCHLDQPCHADVLLKLANATS